MNAAKKSNVPEKERREFPRKPILDSFSLFVVIPARGSHRLRVHDVSEQGLRFDFDLEGEDVKNSPLAEGDAIEARFFLNSSLSIPLQLEVVRVEKKSGLRRVGTKIKSPKASESKAFATFVDLIDVLVETANLS